jgi:hypothetical protein
MLLADFHEHESMSGLPLAILIVLGIVVAGVALLALLRRKSGTPPAEEPSDRVKEVPSPANTPDASDIWPNILEMLRQKGFGVPQSEIVQDSQAAEADVVNALAYLEKRGLIRRTWDAGKRTFIVEAV